MPRDPSSNYTLPPSYLATAGQTIRTEQHNPPLEDLAQAMSASLARDGRGGMVGPLDMGTFPIRNLAPGTVASDAATVGQAGAPVGSILDFAGATAPASWFLCAGQAVSRADYPALFAVIGTTYGVGNGSTTFNIPDLRGRVTAGKDDMGGADAARLNAALGASARTLGGAGGASTITLTMGQMPAHQHTGATSGDGLHQHTYQLRGGAGGVGGVDAGGSSALNPNALTGADGFHSHTLTTNVMGGNEAHPNVQPTIIFNKIIKATI